MDKRLLEKNGVDKAAFQEGVEKKVAQIMERLRDDVPDWKDRGEAMLQRYLGAVESGERKENKAFSKAEFDALRMSDLSRQRWLDAFEEAESGQIADMTYLLEELEREGGNEWRVRKPEEKAEVDELDWMPGNEVAQPGTGEWNAGAQEQVEA